MKLLKKNGNYYSKSFEKNKHNNWINGRQFTSWTVWVLLKKDVKQLQTNMTLCYIT